MSLRCLALGAMALAISLSTACRLPGKPAPGPEVPRPDSVLDSKVLYSQNCAGCHGADGTHGAAPPLGDPVYLAIVSDDTLRSVAAKGRPGTAMSAFAQREGGMLTDAQVEAIAKGIRQRWSKSSALAGVALPPYAATTPGDVQRGEGAYATFCASCHGANGTGGSKAGNIVEPAYLSLITDQALRTIIITGRPDFNAPDWRGNVPNHPMTDQEITDVVAWLASHRPAVVRPQSVAAVPPGLTEAAGLPSARLEGARLQPRHCCPSLKNGGDQSGMGLIPASNHGRTEYSTAEAVLFQSRNVPGGSQ